MVVADLPNVYACLVYRNPSDLLEQADKLLRRMLALNRKVIIGLPFPAAETLQEKFRQATNRQLFFLAREEYRAWCTGKVDQIRRYAEALCAQAAIEGRPEVVLVAAEKPPGDEWAGACPGRPPHNRVIRAVAGLPLSVYVFCAAPAAAAPGASGPAPTSFPPRIRRMGLVLDREARRAEIRGRSVELSPLEFDLLWFLACHPGRIFSRRELLLAVWGHSFGEETVTAHIYRLRRKIEPDPRHPVYIETIRGVGYRFGPGPALFR
ncbi:MAG: winged helix-turn-helix domain-containing protein [Bacillota bacterium]